MGANKAQPKRVSYPSTNKPRFGQAGRILCMDTQDTNLSIADGFDESTLLPWEGRAIMLLDLDAFFASVEQLDHPEWHGKPVIVGGDADKRGVVSTCSYEARSFGVRSAMPASTARRLCPEAIWTSGNFARYREMSQAVMQIMLKESPFLQQVSIDEAFMDITPSEYSREHPVLIAQRIQSSVDTLGITCSIGLGVSKSVAKVASDIDKPHGLTCVYPGREEEFLSGLPCKCMSGIGKVAQQKLSEIGIHTLGEVANADPSLLKPIFGKNVAMMQLRCKGADTDEVESPDVAKSVSNEMSFAQDLDSREDIEAAIATVSAKVARRLRRKNTYASGISLKLRYSDFSVRSIQKPLDMPSNDEYCFIEALNEMLPSLWQPGMRVRLVGMATFGLTNSQGNDSVQPTQLSLLDMVDESAEASKDEEKYYKRQKLIDATDNVRNRFGEHAVTFGRELRTYNNLTGSSSKNPEDYKD